MSSQQDHQNAPEQAPRSTQDMLNPDQNEVESHETSNEALPGSLHHSKVIGSEQFEEFDRELHHRIPSPEDLNFSELSSIVDELQERIDLERQQEANPERERFILHINDWMCQLTLLMIGLLNSSLGI